MESKRIHCPSVEAITGGGSKDQYADGKAVGIWEEHTGDDNPKTQVYKDLISGILRSYQCKNVLDVACGTGVDSTMLLEEGFKMTSVDLSDKMLKYAHRIRWDRRKEPGFDDWEIGEANWLTLTNDLKKYVGTFDAVVCLGNSFAHLPDISGDKSEQRKALKNFEAMLKPGGILILDHRNYDAVLKNGVTSAHNVYYNSNHMDIVKTSVLYVNGVASLVTLDYLMDYMDEKDSHKKKDQSQTDTFQLSYYPHKVKELTGLIKETFGPNSNHKLYGDTQPVEQVANPGFYMHVIQKST